LMQSVMVHVLRRFGGAGTGNARGSTLIESLIAISIFGLGMAAIGNLLVSHIRMQGLNLTYTTAIGLAERELEDLRAINYAHIVNRSSTQTVDGIRYTITTTVTTDVPLPNEKSIMTVVSWTDRSGNHSSRLDVIYTALTL
jgi:prepilin-type N-terminal cleavage/methylation domain-containing protein